MTFVDDVSYCFRRCNELARENERRRERCRELEQALRETADLCNAMRQYAPTLNREAEHTLRRALDLIGDR